MKKMAAPTGIPFMISSEEKVIGQKACLLWNASKIAHHCAETAATTKAFVTAKEGAGESVTACH
jgi:hypothetical protein